MTFELDNKATGIHAKATSSLPGNNININSNLTDPSSLVNSGWKESHGKNG